MSEEKELESHEAFEKFGALAAIIAFVLAAVPAILMFLSKASIFLIILVAMLVFGVSFGLALWGLGDPKGFLREVMANLTSGFNF